MANGFRWPDGLAEIKEYFGDPRPYIQDHGEVSPEWRRQILVPVFLPVSLPLSWDRKVLAPRIHCHYLVAPSLRDILGRLHAEDLFGPDSSGLTDYGGCYCWRLKGNRTGPSTHAWGIAVDFNTASNAYGAAPLMPIDVVEVFESAGWVWGGRWSPPDGMHFQACKGY